MTVREDLGQKETNMLCCSAAEDIESRPGDGSGRPRERQPHPFLRCQRAPQATRRLEEGGRGAHHGAGHQRLAEVNLCKHEVRRRMTMIYQK